MTTLLLSAGQASRLGDLAPAGCKALLQVGGRSMLDWWTSLDPDLTVVVRSEHVRHLPAGTSYVVCDVGGGPALAAAAATRATKQNGPITVAYADTWIPEMPIGDQWCAVGAARGGRRWYVVEDRFLTYTHVPMHQAALVAIGAFRFPTHGGLLIAIENALFLHDGGGEVGFDEVVNAHGGLPLVPAFGWQDVGDPRSYAEWRAIA